MSLPSDYQKRKEIPLYTFLTQYFPDAIVELVKVSVAGNAQHNPGEPLHWSREKSSDQLNTAMRHIFDHGAGATYDEDGTMHLAKAAWRLLAEIQLTRERHTGKAPIGVLDVLAVQSSVANGMLDACDKIQWRKDNGL